MPTESLPTFLHLNLASEWQTFLARRVRWREYPMAQGTKDAFGDALRLKVSNPASVARYLVFCTDCGNPGVSGHFNSNQAGQPVCQPCFSRYVGCDHCRVPVPRNSRIGTVEGYNVCLTCRENSYTYCRRCRGHYHNRNGSSHLHGKHCCTSPAREFTVRNADADEPLANDVRVKVTLPAGEISDEGLGGIANAIRTFAYNEFYNGLSRKDYDAFNLLSFSLGVLGNKWQTKDGNYTKRLSRLAYKEHGLKLPPALISEVGNAASDHSKAVDHWVEVTRKLNGSSRSFGNSGSCWWESYAQSRCALKTNGGFGLRAFAGEGGDVAGRVWVLPLKQEKGLLLPTFETLDPAAYVLFNGYHSLNGYTGARVFCHMVGWTYRKINFQASPMYVNNSSGYLVAPEELASQYKDKLIAFELDRHSNLFDREQPKKEAAYA